MMSWQKDKTFVFIVGWFLFVCFLSLGIKTEPRLRDFCCSIWKNITKKHVSDGDIKAEFQFKYTLFHLSIKSTHQNEETNHLKLLKLILIRTVYVGLYSFWESTSVKLDTKPHSDASLPFLFPEMHYRADVNDKKAFVLPLSEES